MYLFSFFPAVARRFFSKPMQKLPLIFSLSPSSLTTTAQRQNIPPPPPSSQASPILNGTFAPPIGNDRIRQQEQEKKQALAGALDDVVSGSLSAADGASDAARQALGSLEAKVSASFVAAALPPAAKAGATETAAAAAALKNATVNAARDKAVLAAKTKRAFRDAAGAALDRAWGRAAGLESDVSEPLQLSKATLVGGGGGGSSSSSSSSSDADYVGAGPPPRKTRAAVAAGRAATAATLETAGKLFDAAFLKGRKEQFGSSWRSTSGSIPQRASTVSALVQCRHSSSSSSRISSRRRSRRRCRSSRRRRRRGGDAMLPPRSLLPLALTPRLLTLLVSLRLPHSRSRRRRHWALCSRHRRRHRPRRPPYRPLSLLPRPLSTFLLLPPMQGKERRCSRARSCAVSRETRSSRLRSSTPPPSLPRCVRRSSPSSIAMLLRATSTRQRFSRELGEVEEEFEEEATRASVAAGLR